MYELKQLRCFVAVAREMHFGRAARLLHMTQPPLSRQVQMLEDSIGVQLLSRTSRSVRLTPAGRAFLPDARRILALSESAANTAQRIAKGESGLIRIGFTAGSSYSFLPRLLAAAKANLPDVGVALTEMVSMQQMGALVNGDDANRIDIGLLRPPVDERELGIARMAGEPLLLAVAAKHRFAVGEPPTIEDLAHEPFITYSPVEGRYFYELIEGIFREAGVQARYVQHISQIHSILALVSAGIGIAMVPESAFKLHFEGSVLRSLPAVKVSAELLLVWRKNNENPALPVFLNAILKTFPASKLPSI